MDLWTLFFQAINFLLFVAILHHLLYRPVLKTMEERRESMEADLEEAKKERAEAADLKEEAEQERQDLQQERKGLLEEARQQAEEEHKELMAQAEADGEKALEQFRAVMEREKKESFRQAADFLGDAVISATRKILESAGGSLNRKAVSDLKEALSSAEGSALRSARESVESGKEGVKITTAHPWKEDEQEQIQKLLKEQLDCPKNAIHFETDPELVAGVRLSCGELQIDAHWRQTISNTLKQETEDLLNKKKQAEEAEDGDSEKRNHETKESGKTEEEPGSEDKE